ncbi:acyltransferase [Sphingomonas sp. R647]|uniref:acyltransferase n=1 Tax=Sphingomonas sp. R647 TaxID=2875233 RepID=UPI001CD52B89|nr:acyltransferase [Sphingomonas sp. R647]MCA1200120.1 acyltransferase [Sphingomonas sp. R647]
MAINPGVKLEGVTINGVCKFNKVTLFGSNCHVNGVWVDGKGEVEIGNDCHFGKDIKIFTQNHNYKSAVRLPYDDSYELKPVKIGNYVWVGSHVIILPGSIIGDGVIVQAGAVVHGRLEDCGIYGGNPAVRFGSRNVDDFSRLNQYAC